MRGYSGLAALSDLDDAQLAITLQPGDPNLGQRLDTRFAKLAFQFFHGDHFALHRFADHLRSWVQSCGSFPPSLRYDPERFEAFFSLLPSNTQEALALAREHDGRLEGRSWLVPPSRQRIRHAVEVRHPSFMDPGFIAMLRQHKIAVVVADTAGRWPLIEDVTADFVYMRLHGDKELYASGYGNAALARWAERIDAWRHGRQVKDAKRASPLPAPRRARRDVFCYFDNDVKVHAPYDAAAGHAARRCERAGA